MYGNSQNQTGIGYPPYQGYQGQIQVNQGQVQGQYYNNGIFAHPNQNPGLFQQVQFQSPPPAQPQNFYYQNQQQNQSQYYPPMPQYPQQQQQQSYHPIQNPYTINPSQYQNNTHYPQIHNQIKPQNQDDSIKIPPELNEPANPLELKSSSLTSLYKPYRSPFSINDDSSKTSGNAHKNFHQPNSNDSFAYIPPPFSFDPQSDNCCSFLKNGRQPCNGSFYFCNTCQKKISEIPNNNKSQSVIICESCAKKCHSGHDLQKVNPSCPVYCDCGSGNIERRMGPNSHSMLKCKIVPSNITSCIMYMNNNNMQNQYPLFYCETCSINNKNTFIVCNACASICHSGHKLNPAGVGNICNCNDCKTCKLYEQVKKK